MELTLERAQRICKAAIEKAESLGILINVSVCDSGGRLVAFQRMDGAIWAGSIGSQGKAIASAAFGRVSGELTERAWATGVQVMVEGPWQSRRSSFMLYSI